MEGDEIDALKQFKEGLSFDGERYEVSTPWKKDHPKLKNNYNQAMKLKVTKITKRLHIFHCNDQLLYQDYQKNHLVIVPVVGKY